MPLTETDNQRYFDQHRTREKTCAQWLKAQSKTVRKPIVFAALAGIINGVAVVVQAALLASMLSSLIIDNSVVGWAEARSPSIANDGLPYVSPSYIVGLIAIFLLRSICVYAQQIAGFNAGATVRTNIRRQLTDTFALNPAALKQQQSGALAAVSLEQVDALALYFSRYLPQQYIVGVLPFIMLAVVMPVNWLVGLILLVTAPLIPLFMALIGMGAASTQRDQFLALTRMSGYFLDRLQGLATLKLFGQAEAELTAIHRSADDFREKTMSVLRIAFLSSAVLEFFSAVAVALVAVYVGLSLLGQIHFTFAPAVSFKIALFVLLLAPEFFLPLRQLAIFYHDRAAALGAADAILTILEQNVGWGELANPNGNERHCVNVGVRASPQPTLEFNNVSKFYDQRQVLTDINLHIHQGEKIALVGASGAGKTTLLNLLLGFETVSAGNLWLNGETLNRNNATHIMAYVGQNAYIFYGSIADNIALANANATAEQIHAAAHAAGVTEFSDQLPQGLQTLVGERGYGLSGGQVQRIAVARAFLKNAEIIVLDEPTANLDKVTKIQLLAMIAELFNDKTIIIASHDDEVISGMDRKIILQHGRLLS
ncbi:MAG: thiol reductant ABC exporter subunit CydD [Methylococcales bacterium]|nr:thiol reductant ABC exporter subunit CydD [Methylococcales bacterium]